MQHYRPIHAPTLLDQLGGAQRLHAMLGAHVLVAGHSVTIQFKGCRKHDRVVITLNSRDLYDLAFHRYDRKTLECPITARRTDIPADALVRVFDAETGLRLTLGA